MTEPLRRRPMSDDAKRLTDAVAYALRGCGFDDVGGYMATTVFGSGRLLEPRGEVQEFRLIAEVMLRQILAACTAPGVADVTRRQQCWTALAMGGFSRTPKRVHV